MKEPDNVELFEQAPIPKAAMKMTFPTVLSCLANCAACIYFFGLLYGKRGKTFVCIHPAKFRLERTIAGEVCGVGVPAAIQNLLNVIYLKR